MASVPTSLPVTGGDAPTPSAGADHRAFYIPGSLDKLPAFRGWLVSRDLCLAFMDDLETRDLERLRRWFTEQSVLWMPPRAPVQGSSRILATFRGIFRLYREIHWRVTEVHVVSDRRYIYATDSWGIIGDTTPYQNHILTIVEFGGDGRIAYLSDYFKDTAIFSAGRSQHGEAKEIAS